MACPQPSRSVTWNASSWGSTERIRRSSPWIGLPRERRARRSVEIVTVAAEDPPPESAEDVAIRDAQRRVADRAPDAEVKTRTCRVGCLTRGRAAENADLLVIGAHRRKPSDPR